MILLVDAPYGQVCRVATCKCAFISFLVWWAKIAVFFVFACPVELHYTPADAVFIASRGARGIHTILPITVVPIANHHHYHLLGSNAFHMNVVQCWAALIAALRAALPGAKIGYLPALH